MSYAPSKDSDHPAHPCSPISPCCALHGQLRTQGSFMRTVKMATQADLSLHWAPMSFCQFYRAAAQI